MLEAPARSLSAPAALVLAAVSGTFIAVQARLNGELRLALDDTLLAAVVSFTGGLLVLLAVVLPRASARRALARVREVPLWQRLGGLGGAVLIAASAASASVLGVALLTLALVAGQTAGGMLVDRVGLGPGGPRPVTPARVAGLLLCLGAVSLAAPGSAGAADPLLLLLVALSGLLVSAGAALNGRVKATTGAASVTTLLNFAVGTGALVGALVLHAAVTGLPDPDWPGPGAWWLYTGGLLGAAFVAVAAVVVRVLGVLHMSLAVVSGQVVGALALDTVVPFSSTRVSGLTVLSAALALAAVAVAGRGAR